MPQQYNFKTYILKIAFNGVIGLLSLAIVLIILAEFIFNFLFGGLGWFLLPGLIFLLIFGGAIITSGLISGILNSLLIHFTKPDNPERMGAFLGTSILTLGCSFSISLFIVIQALIYYRSTDLMALLLAGFLALVIAISILITHGLAYSTLFASSQKQKGHHS